MKNRTTAKRELRKELLAMSRDALLIAVEIALLIMVLVLVFSDQFDRATFCMVTWLALRSRYTQPESEGE